MSKKLKKKRIKKVTLEPEKLEKRFNVFLEGFDSVLEEFTNDYEVMCGNTDGFTPSLDQIIKAETILEKLKEVRDKTELLAETLKPLVRHPNEKV